MVVSLIGPSRPPLQAQLHTSSMYHVATKSRPPTCGDGGSGSIQAPVACACQRVTSSSLSNRESDEPKLTPQIEKRSQRTMLASNMFWLSLLGPLSSSCRAPFADGLHPGSVPWDLAILGFPDGSLTDQACHVLHPQLLHALL